MFALGRRLFFSFILLSLFLFPFPAGAQTADAVPVGTLIEIEGEAAIRRGIEPPLAAAIDMPVYLEDIIETGAESRAHVLFIDDTEITLGENASLAVDEYFFDPEDTSGNKGRFSILRGAFLYVSGLMPKNDNPDVEIETAYGSIGVRGTTVWGGDLEGAYGILVPEGEVRVRTRRSVTRIGPGQGTSFTSPNAAPAPVREWAPEKVERAVRTIALKHKDAVRERIAARKTQHAAMRARHREFIRNRGEKVREKIQDMSPEQRQQLKERIEQAPPEKKEQIKERVQEKRGQMQEREQNAPKRAAIKRGSAPAQRNND